MFLALIDAFSDIHIAALAFCLCLLGTISLQVSSVFILSLSPSFRYILNKNPIAGFMLFYRIGSDIFRTLFHSSVPRPP